ncbi:hypothetical protein CYMTET_27621 [Cymbomonas tetramitiformis]|uniref:Uncharacterized protein n=1 Tax=Cymbomonas tetramitiformis TaxID=36881 RepID=A0AAE0KWQ5_9CHLO|nr:hypothetical protein CYMTET_27621 [Cymbomonas tetramitiformis]
MNHLDWEAVYAGYRELIDMQRDVARPQSRRMVSLGKVNAPKPINLPSQRRENNGLDPSVNIVAKAANTWSAAPDSSAEEASNPGPWNSTPQPTASAVPSAPTPGVQNPAGRTQPSSEPAPFPPAPWAVQQQPGAPPHHNVNDSAARPASTPWGGANPLQQHHKATEALRMQQEFPELGKEAALRASEGTSPEHSWAQRSDLSARDPYSVQEDRWGRMQRLSRGDESDTWRRQENYDFAPRRSFDGAHYEQNGSGYGTRPLMQSHSAGYQGYNHGPPPAGAHPGYPSDAPYGARFGPGYGQMPDRERRLDPREREMYGPPAQQRPPLPPFGGPQPPPPPGPPPPGQPMMGFQPPPPPGPPPPGQPRASLQPGLAGDAKPQQPAAPKVAPAPAGPEWSGMEDEDMDYAHGPKFDDDGNLSPAPSPGKGDGEQQQQQPRKEEEDEEEPIPAGGPRGDYFGEDIPRNADAVASDGGRHRKVVRALHTGGEEGGERCSESHSAAGGRGGGPYKEQQKPMRILRRAPAEEKAGAEAAGTDNPPPAEVMPKNGPGPGHKNGPSRAESNGGGVKGTGGKGKGGPKDSSEVQLPEKGATARGAEKPSVHSGRGGRDKRGAKDGANGQWAADGRGHVSTELPASASPDTEKQSHVPPTEVEGPGGTQKKASLSSATKRAEEKKREADRRTAEQRVREATSKADGPDPSWTRRQLDGGPQPKQSARQQKPQAHGSSPQQQAVAAAAAAQGKGRPARGGKESHAEKPGKAEAEESSTKPVEAKRGGGEPHAAANPPKRENGRPASAAAKLPSGRGRYSDNDTGKSAKAPPASSAGQQRPKSGAHEERPPKEVGAKQGARSSEGFVQHDDVEGGDKRNRPTRRARGGSGRNGARQDEAEGPAKGAMKADEPVPKTSDLPALATRPPPGLSPSPAPQPLSPSAAAAAAALARPPRPSQTSPTAPRGAPGNNPGPAKPPAPQADSVPPQVVDEGKPRRQDREIYVPRHQAQQAPQQGSAAAQEGQAAAPAANPAQGKGKDRKRGGDHRRGGRGGGAGGGGGAAADDAGEQSSDTAVAHQQPRQAASDERKRGAGKGKGNSALTPPTQAARPSSQAAATALAGRGGASDGASSAPGSGSARSKGGRGGAGRKGGEGEGKGGGERRSRPASGKGGQVKGGGKRDEGISQANAPMVVV